MYSIEKGETLIETLISSIILTTTLSSILMVSQLLNLIKIQTQELVQATQLVTSISESLRFTNDINQFKQLWQNKVASSLTNGQLTILEKNNYWLIKISWKRSNIMTVANRFLCLPENAEQYCISVAASKN